jgi:hypothetical protein
VLLVGNVLVLLFWNSPFTVPPVLRSACSGGLSTRLYLSGAGDGFGYM